MPFTIPNAGEISGANEALARPDARDFDIMAMSEQGTKVLRGCAITKGTGAMAIDVAAGVVIIDGVAKFTAGIDELVLPNGDATNPRIDLITVDTAGTVARVAGTAAANPLIPAVPASRCPLAIVHVIALATSITSAEIVDKRLLHGREIVSLDRTGAQLSLTGNTAENTLYTYTIPGRLLDVGGGLRLSMGGLWSYLSGSGSKTTTIRVKIGATTVFTFTFSKAALSANVAEWTIYFIFVNAATNSQKWSIEAKMTNQTALNIDSVDNPTHDLVGHASSAEDTQTDKALTITAQHNATEQGINRELVSLEYLP